MIEFNAVSSLSYERCQLVATQYTTVLVTTTVPRTAAIDRRVCLSNASGVQSRCSRIPAL
ncbi:uncharacterized protein PHACADRAFT_166259 [Phanerochaete carnosa HHB-10118-sp]|uniref:Uncharacterized protein n=1 Tax=Phanerochaete carnosa (strain HHB-10118-sp) TaxID=650164 RepID=K5VVH3_PHACS|nr:uncharacterized protein PHACADRAFT_166259 [Phanerochaete carnosa HHB-10118-sp]EKM50579.1 hypothetical protein PHACADRAFT_166259 [Phanerochaete carnosa HHB-10118-sp]